MAKQIFQFEPEADKKPLYVTINVQDRGTG